MSKHQEVEDPKWLLALEAHEIALANRERREKIEAIRRESRR